MHTYIYVYIFSPVRTQNSWQQFASHNGYSCIQISIWYRVAHQTCHLSVRNTQKRPTKDTYKNAHTSMRMCNIYIHVTCKNKFLILNGKQELPPLSRSLLRTFVGLFCVLCVGLFSLATPKKYLIQDGTQDLAPLSRSLLRIFVDLFCVFL